MPTTSTPALLTDIPEGYELVSTGDITINGGWIWVEVKPSTKEIGVNYWDVENNKQAGEGKVLYPPMPTTSTPAL